MRLALLFLFLLFATPASAECKMESRADSLPVIDMIKNLQHIGLYIHYTGEPYASAIACHGRETQCTSISSHPSGYDSKSAKELEAMAPKEVEELKTEYETVPRQLRPETLTPRLTAEIKKQLTALLLPNDAGCTLDITLMTGWPEMVGCSDEACGRPMPANLLDFYNNRDNLIVALDVDFQTETKTGKKISPAIVRMSTHLLRRGCYPPIRNPGFPASFPVNIDDKEMAENIDDFMFQDFNATLETVSTLKPTLYSYSCRL